MLATTLDGCDVLLGRDWLHRFNPTIDWTTGAITVLCNKGRVTLAKWAEPEPMTTRVNAITLKRAIKRGAQGYAVQLYEVVASEKIADIDTLCAAVPDDVASIIRRYPEIFADDLPDGLPPQRPEDHRIELEPGAKPTVRSQWRLSQPELDELRKQLDYLLSKGFIRPSTSPYAAPILFTPKKDGGLRMCIDYRALNRITIKSRYPIPRADDLLDQLRGARFFSKIDLRGGYHQIRVFADDCPKTAFRTRYGCYEYTVMPFGLTNAPSTFQLTMNGVFRDMLDKKVIVYLDDILVYSKTREQHLQDLEEVFRRLQQNRLITKALSAFSEWKAPTNITELQSFLGFVNYVRRFVPNMAGVTRPLTDLLHKGVQFLWGEREQLAFDELKKILSSPPVLRLADPSRPFEVVTDASDFAVGAVLLQDFGNGLQPIAYESRKMQPPERNYPVHDKEMLAIVHAFRTWRCYLTGADVTIRTDHKSLQYMRSQPQLNPRQIRWLDYLESNFSYTITYKKGANNIADALTFPSMQTAAVLIAHSNQPAIGRTIQARLQDRQVFQDQSTSTSHHSTWQLLPKSRHFGVDKTLKLLQQNYYWPEMASDV
ncbi:unnamed protein product [Closterium sp. Yama58-4]|nr:unnamed protein product [Closterium sp. Yama58-4]